MTIAIDQSNRCIELVPECEGFVRALDYVTGGEIIETVIGFDGEE